MAKTTFVLDTNVLLSDPAALFAFEDNFVILPLMVIEELDNHKNRQDEVGRNARETTRKLSEILKGHPDVKSGAPLMTGGLLKILSVEDIRGNQRPVTMPPELLGRETGDNRIIELCLELLDADTEDQVLLVSRDILLRIKAESVGIECTEYKKLPTGDAVSKLYSGVREIEGDFDIKKLYDDGELFLEEADLEGLMPNQFMVLKNGTQSGLVRYFAKSEPVSLVKPIPAGKVNSRNKEQTFALDLLSDTDVKLVTLAGFAGCGKTLLAIASGLEQVLAKKYKTLVICRPVQSVGKEIGFLPGTIEEKMEPWIAPIKDNLRFLLGNGKRARQVEETLQMLFDEGTIEIQAMTYIRGRSIAGAYMVIDESQNLSMHELKTIITRVGEGTKIVLTGDIEQIDNQSVDSLSNGLTVAIEKFKEHAIAGHVTLTKGERSELATLAAKIL